MATLMKAMQVAVSNGIRFVTSITRRALGITALLALGELAHAMNGAPNPSADGDYTVYWSLPTGHYEEPAIDPWIPYSIYDVYLVEQINGGGATQVATSQGNSSKTFSGKANGTYSYSIISAGVTYFVGQAYPFSNVIENIDTPVTVSIIPSTPGGLSHNGGNPNYTGSYTVSWANVDGASSYELQERVNGGGWLTVHNGGAISWTASGKSAVNTYSYQVRACAGAECSGYSGPVDAVVNVPDAPGGLGHDGGNPNYTGSYTVSWANVDGASSYQLQERVNGGGWVTVHNGGAISWTASGKSAVNTYSYQVRACAGAGCSGYSGTVDAVVNVPGVPGGLGHDGGNPNYTGSYTVSWSGTSGASSYQLEEQQNAGGWVVFSPTSNTSFGISGRPLGTHRYAVRACGGGGQCSAYSSPITVAVAALATTYEYDALGRVVRVTYNDGSYVTYGYDAAGNRFVVAATKL